MGHLLVSCSHQDGMEDEEEGQDNEFCLLRHVSSQI